MDTLQPVKKFTFKRSQRLKSRKTIEMLFAQNRSLKLFPLKLVYALQPAPAFGCEVAFVASKRNFKNAVDRNRIKRLMREAYRHNALPFTNQLTQLPVKISFMLIYQGDTETPYRELDLRMKQLLSRMAEKVVKEQPELLL